MTRILVVDDQALTERAAQFRTLKGDVTCVTAFPAWDTFWDFDTIYWDNDLGEPLDVVDQLKAMLREDHEQFCLLFDRKTHIVHSANPVAARRIKDLFEDIGAAVVVAPITCWSWE